MKTEDMSRLCWAECRHHLLVCFRRWQPQAFGNSLWTIRPQRLEVGYNGRQRF